MVRNEVMTHKKRHEVMGCKNDMKTCAICRLFIKSNYNIYLLIVIITSFFRCNSTAPYTDEGETERLRGLQMKEYNRMFTLASRYLADNCVDSDFSDDMCWNSYELMRNRLITSEVILLDKQLCIDTIHGYNANNKIHFVPEMSQDIVVNKFNGRIVASQYYLGRSEDGKYPHVFFLQNVYHKKDSTYIAETYFAVPNCNPYSVFNDMEKKVTFEDIAFRYTMLDGNVGNDSLKHLLSSVFNDLDGNVSNDSLKRILNIIKK
jgi:hypothetical protein